MHFSLQSIVKNFKICGTYLSGIRYGNGHIHDTFLIKTDVKNCPGYILQRINHDVFNDIPGLMHNIERVTGHIRLRLSQSLDTEIDRHVLTLIPTIDDHSFFLDDEGNYWRIYFFIHNSYYYDVIESAEMAYRGGRAYGKFQSLLADFPDPPLNETIPGFHNIERRLETFWDTVEKNPFNRVHDIPKEIQFVSERAEEMKQIHRLGKEGKIPFRITHNDTKFNNILFDKNNNPLCIIDLDTVMPGYIHYDFGDAIRTCTNTAAEDEEDLEKVAMNIRLFEAYARGFLKETRSFLNEDEILNLAFAAKLFAFMIGLRFLTDYIDGDKYFKIYFDGQNLKRARVQFKLLVSMEEQYEAMQKIIIQLLEK